MEPGSSGLGGWAALKLALAFGVPAGLTALVGLMVMPPRSVREFIARTACTVVCSFLFGPPLAMAAIAWRPALMESALWMAHHSGIGDDSLLALFYILAPCMLMAGLPAWWVLGAYMRWMARMREQGVPAWLGEARRTILGAGPKEK